MRKLLLATFCLAVFVVDAAAQNPKVVTAAQANGVYRYYDSEFRILALGPNKLKVQFDGIYHTLAKSVNMGSATGEAPVVGMSPPSSHPTLNSARSRWCFCPAN